MKNLIAAFVHIVILISLSLDIHAEELTATQILERVDSVFNGPKDRTTKMRLVLTNKKGNEQERIIMMMQKGNNKRLGKFLSPADQKGIGFLSLPDGIMYVYLPEYKKTRRIASHVKNTKFAGTDFTYEDMEAKNYSENWKPEIINAEDDFYTLELIPKEGVKTDYSKKIVWVRASTFFIEKIELYDRGNNLKKIMSLSEIEKIDGYLTARETTMEDIKLKHTTRMILEEIKYDTGLSDDTFTERYLQR